MNRQIKFRAWHTRLNKMFSAEELGEDQMTLSVDGRGFVNVSSRSTSESQFAGEKMIPLQFTGLLDKNGKEIYEGDIVEGPSDSRPVAGQHSSSNKRSNARFQIVWREWGYGQFDSKSIGPMERTYPGPKSVEIIGNIYENSDLLV